MPTYTLADLIDIPRLQSLLDEFYTATSVPSAILDTDNTVLTASGWQRICTSFHRVHADAVCMCQQSDAYILTHLGQGERYVIYECAHGLVDVANPIIVAGQHLGTVFTGQFVFEPPDRQRFREQAQHFGFNEGDYLIALDEVPVISREKITPILRYLSQFTELLAEVGYERMQQLELRAALEQAHTEQAQLQARLHEVQSATSHELAVPLLPIADHVLTLPLVGTIDAQRTGKIMETLLDGVARHQARIAIVDITGVRTVDTQVAQALVQAAQAVRLLGAQVVLTGIQPQISQTLVHLGVDLEGIITRSSLQSGIAYALQTEANHASSNGSSPLA